jgi:hypothetical protein
MRAALKKSGLSKKAQYYDTVLQTHYLESGLTYTLHSKKFYQVSIKQQLSTLTCLKMATDKILESAGLSRCVNNKKKLSDH